MRSLLSCPRIVLLLLLALCHRPLAAADWIWSEGKPADDEVRFFRKEFRLTDVPSKATLTVACDNKATIFLDGRNVGENTEWNTPTVIELAPQLKAGHHLLAIRAENHGGSAGLLARLEVNFPMTRKEIADGPTIKPGTFETDTTWQVSDKGPPGWNQLENTIGGFKAARSLGKLGVQPWGNVFAAAPAGRAPRGSAPATPAESLKVLPGFKVELLRSSLPGEGSWVAMTVDPKGRLIVSPQDKEPMLRFTLGPEGQIVKMETLDVRLNGAMGLLYAFDSLYVNGAGPDGYHLYRVRDTDGDDQFDKVELLRKWKGGPGEHGSHGIVLGPDNKLYIVCGNFVDVPDDILATSPHRNYADDQVLPRMEDGNGFGAGRKPPGGYVVRMDKDGKNCELFASGQRNTYDIAFNPDGELFGFDSDMEWDWGAPWYRPTRVYHIVSAGDQGFREGSAKWPEAYPDSLPGGVNIGIGSPTGVKFGTRANFPPKYQRACYAMDWSYGRIVAVHHTPDGASYRGTFESFVSGKPLNVTDLEIGNDGAMYFTIGGRRTQGGLYRVSYTGPVVKEEAFHDAPAVAARELRHELETYHGRREAKAIDLAWPHLDSPDRHLRYAARIAIEAQPVEDWQKRALDEERKRASLTALLALARLGSASVQDELLQSLGRHWPNDLDDEQKLETLRVCEVAFARMGRPSEEVSADVASSLNRVFPAKSWPLNRELSQLLIYLQAPGIVKQVLDLRDKAATQEEQLHYMVALRNAKTWTLDERKRYFAWFRNRPATVDGGPTYPGGASYFISRNTKHTDEMNQWFRDVGREYGDGSSYANFLKKLKAAAAEPLDAAETNALAGFITDTPAVASTSTSTKPKRQYKIEREWTMADLVGDLDRAGKGRSYDNGRDAFAAAKCLDCHRFGNEGGAVGPDITAISSRFSRRDLLESIIEPSKVVSEQYQNITVTKKDGDDVTGRLVEETDTKLVLVPNQLTNDKVEVKKSEVASRAPSKLSPMPEALVNVLTKDDMLDLLAYIESAGKKDHAAFR